MKKAITFRLCIVVLVSMLATSFLSYYLQVKSAQEAFLGNAKIRIEQVAQVLDRNAKELTTTQENLKEDYFIRAKAASYILERQPWIIQNQQELQKVAELLRIDELHVFDTKGEIYAGTHPEYYGLTFDSGSQMQYFLPMLTDTNLQLYQDVTPNTAERKLMQYSAVWREDKKGIIQIGMGSARLLAVMRRNEISYIFPLMTTEKGSTIMAIAPESGVILGATNQEIVGKTLKSYGIDVQKVFEEKDGFTTEIAGEKSYAVFQRAGDVLIGVSTTYGTMYESVGDNMLLIILGLCTVAIVVIIILLRMIDSFIIRGIHDMIGGMEKISKGDLDTRVEVRSAPEFVELSDKINQMVLSLLETNNKLSLVFQNVDIPIAVYEYNQDMKRVQATSKIADILMLSKKEMAVIIKDHDAFSQKINAICQNPFQGEKDVFSIEGKDTRYIRVQSYQEDRSTWGIIVDVTVDILEKQQIKSERDVDYLTGLASRRAFFQEMETIFDGKDDVGVAVILMLDLDNLKYVNDSLGHEFGDLLLQTAATLLGNCTAPKKSVARLGGDEFVLVLYGAETEEELEISLERLFQEIQKSSFVVPNGEEVSVSMSGGYIFHPSCGESYRTMMRLADETMYGVKRNGKGYFAKYQEKEER